jgi:hypothetical protein
VKIGDLVETHKGVRGVVLDTEKLYPGHPQSPLRNVLVQWLDDAPVWHVKGRWTDRFAVKVISHAKR